jgi:large subunit ribosomal protein L21
MYAIVDIAGQQFKVQKDQKIFVHRLEGEEGSKVDFDQILLIDDDGKIQVGNPVVENTVVKATIVSQLRGDTVKVFKKKRRKGYQKLNGHRQYLSQVIIDSIGEGKAEAAPKKKAEQPKTAPKAPKANAVDIDDVSAPAKAKKEPVEKKAVKSAAAANTKKATATKKPAEKAKAAKKPVKKKEE